MITAILMNGNKEIKRIGIQVVLYGLFVIDETKERDLETEWLLTKRAVSYCDSVSRETLENFGKDQPEAYLYAYAMLQQFQLSSDDIWVSFPNQDLFTLYPYDDGYKRLDVLKKERCL